MGAQVIAWEENRIDVRPDLHFPRHAGIGDGVGEDVVDLDAGEFAGKAIEDVDAIGCGLVGHDGDLDAGFLRPPGDGAAGEAVSILEAVEFLAHSRGQDQRLAAIVPGRIDLSQG